MKHINVLSLFDGGSFGRLALERAGIKVNKYFSCEIDKHAMAVADANFPDNIKLGDVRNVFAKDLPKIDLVIGGSPCQGFSFAGKQLNFDDERSKLFFEFVRLLKECKPKYFLLENVKMSKQSENVISKYLGMAPIEINSNLVSAQNRKRLYWTNIGAESDGLFGFQKCMIKQPKDKGILLKDILQKDVPEKYYLSEKALAYLGKDSGNWSDRLSSVNYSDNDKANCVVANFYKGVPYNVLCVASRGRSSCLTSKRTEYGKQIRKDYEAGKIKEKRKNIQQLEPRKDGKTNCLTSVQKDNLVLIVPEATKKGYAEIEKGQCFDNGQPNSKTRRGRKMDNKSNCLLTSNQFMQFTDDCKIRRLTPVECERLQTVPDGYTDCVSDTQRYKILGNGWTVDVISHIFKHMTDE